MSLKYKQISSVQNVQKPTIVSESKCPKSKNPLGATSLKLSLIVLRWKCP